METSKLPSKKPFEDFRIENISNRIENVSNKFQDWTRYSNLNGSKQTTILV